MPLTPFHLGPGLLVGLLFISFIDFPTFLVASVIVDVEPFLVLTLNLDYPPHGFFHSFLGGTLVAFLLSLVMSKIRESLSPLLSFFKLEQKASYKKILLASLSGIYIHILLDSVMTITIKPFYPLDFTPVHPLFSHSPLIGLWVYMTCVWCFIGAASIYAIRLFLAWRAQSSTAVKQRIK